MFTVSTPGFLSFGDFWTRFFWKKLGFGGYGWVWGSRRCACQRTDNKIGVNYKIKTRSQKLRSNTVGGGVAIIFKSTMKVVKMFIRHPDSFESVSVKLKCYDGVNLFCS